MRNRLDLEAGPPYTVTPLRFAEALLKATRACSAGLLTSSDHAQPPSPFYRLARKESTKRGNSAGMNARRRHVRAIKHSTDCPHGLNVNRHDFLLQRTNDNDLQREQYGRKRARGHHAHDPPKEEVVELMPVVAGNVGELITSLRWDPSYRSHHIVAKHNNRRWKKGDGDKPSCTLAVSAFEKVVYCGVRAFINWVRKKLFALPCKT